MYTNRLHRRRASFLLALAIALPVSTVEPFLQHEPAEAMSGVDVVTAPTTAQLLEGANPSAEGTLLTVTENDPAALSLAASHAALVRGPLLVRGADEPAASLRDRARSLGPSAMVAIGSTGGALAVDVLAALEVEAPTRAIEAQGGTQAWLAAAESAPDTAGGPVIASTSDSMAVSFGTALAANQGKPFVAWDEDTDPITLREMLATDPGSNITIVGELGEVPLSGVLEDDVLRVVRVPVVDRSAAQIWAARERQLVGTDISKVFAAPSYATPALALAGRFAAQRGGIAVPVGIETNPASGGASDYLKLLSPASSSVTLVGESATEAQAAALAAKRRTPTGTGQFRVTRLSTVGDQFDIVVRSVAGATSYEAFDVDGRRTLTSTTTTLRVRSSTDAAVVVARSGTKELARMQLRFNDLSSETVGSSAVVLSMRGSENVIRITGPSNRPRLITRTVTDPTAPNSTPSEVPVAITCSTEWVENGLDRSKQYDYSINDLSNAATRTCSPDAQREVADAEEALVLARIDSPATTLRSSRAPARNGANLSITDRLVAEAVRGPGPDGRAAGDGWPDFLVRWNAYIPDAKVPFGPSYVPGRPLLMFHGDGHPAGQPNASVRFRQDLRFRFGSAAGVTYSEQMGESISYACTVLGDNCQVRQRATAPLSQLNGSGRPTSTTSAVANLSASTALPLVKQSPPIDTRISVSIKPGASVLRGYQDKMPHHEAYVGAAQSEWHRVYSSPYGGWYQLPCLASTPTVPIPGCHVYLNARM